MKGKFSRIKNNIIVQTGKFLSFYKIYLLVFFIIFLIGFITGIMTCSNYASSIIYEHLINKYMYKLLLRESSHITFFLILTAYFIIISLFIILFTKNTFMMIFNGVLLALMSYIYGFDICVIILSFGLAGVIFGILILGVLGLLLFLLIMLIMSIATKRFLDSKKICENAPRSFYFKLYLLLIIISVLVIFLISFLFSAIHLFVIVE